MATDGTNHWDALRRADELAKRNEFRGAAAAYLEVARQFFAEGQHLKAAAIAKTVVALAGSRPDELRFEHMSSLELWRDAVEVLGLRDEAARATAELERLQQHR
ncbi:hypothetical protein [Sorangium atrum]|uniref:Uncharacterized protein n=1 Tax=Sorangium atrum TaxID=2995308 RepID=A0ABT5C6U2_9BACT|nr:hypothetical protein [Sorangium aterium]MDC0680887.1 hypothetical protein [Sorangium aterium]